MLADAYLLHKAGQSAVFLDHAAIDNYVARMHISGAVVESLYRQARMAEILRAAMQRAGVPAHYIADTLAEMAPFPASHAAPTEGF